MTTTAAAPSIMADNKFSFAVSNIFTPNLRLMDTSYKWMFDRRRQVGATIRYNELGTANLWLLILIERNTYVAGSVVSMELA